MRNINDNDLKKLLADLPEIDLPEGFHDETMQKLHNEHRMDDHKGGTLPPATQSSHNPKPNPKRRRAIIYIGSFTSAAAVLLAVLITTLNLGQSTADLAPMAMEAPEAAAGQPFAARLVDAEFNFDDADFYGEAWEYGIMAAEALTERPEPEIAMGRTQAQLWDAFENDLWAQAITTDAFPFPDHLPTDHLDPNLAEIYGFAFTFEIIITVDDFDYAREAIINLGATYHEMMLEMVLQPAFEDLETTFAALYALGTIEEYRVTSTNTLVLSNAQHIMDAQADANTISIILLHNLP